MDLRRIFRTMIIAFLISFLGAGYSEPETELHRSLVICTVLFLFFTIISGLILMSYGDEEDG